MPVQTAVGSDLRQLDAPVLRKIVSSGASYTPSNPQIIMLGGDTTVTVDGQSIDLLQGMSFVVERGIVYNFAPPVQLGVS